MLKRFTPSSIHGQFGLTRLVSLSLSILMLGNCISSTVWASSSDVLTGDVHVTVNPANIRGTIPIGGANQKVTMAFHGMDIQDALRALAQQGGFNVLIDESVTGTISVDLNNVSIQDALETLKTYGNLAYSVQGKNLMVASATSEKGVAFKKSVTRIFPLHNANAKVIADFLNSTVFADRTSSAGSTSSGATSGGSSGGKPVTADYQTNSLIVIGDPTDIKTVEEHIEALDQPRQMKTWRLSQANVLDVATMLASSIFNEGSPILATTAASSGSSSSGGGAGAAQNTTPSPLRVTADNLAEGSGASQASQSGGSSSGGSSGGETSLVSSLTLRGRAQQTQTIQISPNGPILLPDTRMNTLTLLGTAEQIAMAESLIPVLDRKVPQVVLEASLVEVSEDGRNELGITSGSNSGHFSSGTNNSTSSTLVNRAFSNAIGRTTSTSTPLESIMRFTTNPTTVTRNFLFQINALVNKNKAKMLANPTVITTSDNETVISIVDEIIRSVTVTQGAFGSTPTFTTNIGEAGIVLNILPKIGANNTVSLRVRPIISTVARTQTDASGNLITLLSKREALAQNVQLKDGETFVLGGLIHDTNTEAVTKNPMLANLPILGALARNSVKNKHRSELMVLITPHILKDDSDIAGLVPNLPGSSLIPATLSNRASGNNGIVPVSFNGTGATTERTNALPALEAVHSIDNSSNGSDPLDHKSLAKPSPKPKNGALLPDEMMPAPKSLPTKPAAKTSMTGPTIETQAYRASGPAKADSSSDTADTSDAAIREIMAKFRTPVNAR
jgi:type II secretory pathway component GspD/PulD (secretin)